MIKLSLADQIEYRRFSGREILMDTPRECTRLWEKGKVTGFHRGQLYVVDVVLRVS